MKPRLILITSTVAPLFLAVHAEASAVAPCVRPNVNEFLLGTLSPNHDDGQYFPAAEAVFTTFHLNGQRFQWIGASWQGPPKGAVFVLGCDGKRLASLSLGFVQHWAPGPVLPNIGATQEVVATIGTGTEMRNDTVNLLGFINGQIKILWSHPAYDVVDFPPNRKAYTDHYEWHHAANYKTILINGWRETQPYGNNGKSRLPGSTRFLSTEQYCWQPERIVYAACK